MFVFLRDVIRIRVTVAGTDFMLSLFYVILFVTSDKALFQPCGLSRQPSLQRGVALVCFHLASVCLFFLMSSFERIVRAFGKLMPELPLLSKTPNDDVFSVPLASGTSAEAAARPEITALLGLGIRTQG